MGKLGVELSYESDLHGEAGIEEVEVTAGGRRHPVAVAQAAPSPARTWCCRSTSGCRSWSRTGTATARGALVAIEPETGDVLAFVSMPTFDPNLFVDGIDVQSWQELNTNPDRPLLNRPLRGTYPPGSTYKPFMALAVSKSGIRKPKETIFDPGYFAARQAPLPRLQARRATARSTCTARSWSLRIPTTTAPPTRWASTTSTTS